MKILIVDDIELNRDILRDMLEEEGWETVAASDGVQALEILDGQHDALQAVLLDLVMPRMDGFQLLEEMKKRSWFPSIPVIVISGENELSTEIRSLELGAHDFIHKPFVRSLVVQRVKNAVQLFLHKNSLEQLVSQQTQALREQAEQIKRNNAKIIDILGTVVEYRNLESGEHISRVKGFTHIMAESMMELFPEYGLTEQMAQLIADASPLHDLGKITIPDNILLKPGRLTPEEFELMKAHTSNGAEMIQRIEGAWDTEYARICQEICRYHHERDDGRGYPDGLKGEEIPVSAQLVSVADVYDALVNKRVYKEAYALDAAYEMIITGQCGNFSPKLLKCFEHARKRFEELACEKVPMLKKIS
ncbi:MAG: response regulator [Eubacteriales bacterium]|nr:response regulator [Eubacteriales bacterium]